MLKRSRLSRNEKKTRLIAYYRDGVPYYSGKNVRMVLDDVIANMKKHCAMTVCQRRVINRAFATLKEK